MRKRGVGQRPLVLLACLTVCLNCPAFASVTNYRDLDAFNAAAGDPPVALDFDLLSPGTDITGNHLEGLTLIGPGAPLIVVRAADTYTPDGFSGTPNPDANKLIATSGENILSPGGVVLGPGSDPAVEDDDLTIVFDVPVAAFGFDHLSQSADGFSFTSFRIKNEAGTVIHSGGVPISNLGGGGAPAAADFFGFVSTEANIKSIEIIEGDSNSQYPDCNIGFDTFRYATPRPVYAINNRDVRGPVVALAAVSSRFTVWGRVSLLDADGFLLDDGSGAPVKVLAPGHSGLTSGAFARATGVLNNAPEPAELTCAPEDVLRLD